MQAGGHAALDCWHGRQMNPARRDFIIPVAIPMLAVASRQALGLRLGRLSDAGSSGGLPPVAANPAGGR